MMDRQKGKFVVECDGPGCMEVLETETGDFSAARERMRQEGWKSRKNKQDEWEHFCEACK